MNKIFALAETENPVELDTFETDGFYFKTPTAPSGGVPLEAMSDGFKSTFVLLFDLIIRAWEKGADMKKPGNITGIVMIDEIDLHLHPSWQRTFLPTLMKVFPNIQFIVTSHSPFIVQSMNTGDIITLSIEEEGVIARKIKLDGKPYGHEIEKIIKEILGEERKIPEISELLFQQLKDFEIAVKKGDKVKATTLYREIKAAIPADSDFKEYIEIMGTGLITEDAGDSR
ncbi:MAG: AAA family ATPase, partial [bacterium]|nr:AAA family ATPase [bacterium]